MQTALADKNIFRTSVAMAGTCSSDQWRAHHLTFGLQPSAY